MLGRMEESTAGLVARYAERFPALNFASPEPGILDLVMSKPGKLNAADRRMHRQLADVWLTVDADDEVDVVVVRGEGGAFSAGGDFDMIDDKMCIRDSFERGGLPRLEGVEGLLLHGGDGFLGVLHDGSLWDLVVVDH